jgi:hypothetical protein
MSNAEMFWIEEISKQKVKAAVTFAIKNVPAIDAWTLQKFLEYVNVSESLDSLSKGELLEKMRLLRKYLPSSCRYSLLMLAELLELAPPTQAGEDKTTVAAHKNRRVSQSQPNFAATF